MTHLQKYNAGPYDIYAVNPNYATVVAKPVPVPSHQQHIQQINSPTPPPQNSPTLQPASNWEKFGMGMLIGLGAFSSAMPLAIALINYLPAPTVIAPTPVIDPVVVHDLKAQNKMLQQHIRNLESQLLLQSGRTCL